MPRKISEEQIESIKQGILNNKFYEDIASELNISKDCVFRYAKKLGLSTGNNFRRKNTLNDNIFNIVNTEEKAYWLGFIVADGGITYTTSYYKENNKPNRLYINLSEKDKIVLEQFQKFIGSSKEIKTYIPKGTYSSNPMCRLIINSTKLCKDLVSNGIIPAKTGKEVFPKNLNKNLIRHFIRGYFDGDGTVYINKARNSLRIAFSGSKSFLIELKQILIKKKILSSDTKICKQGDKECYLFYINKKEDIEKFFDYLYKDSTVYLKRKYDTFGNSLY